MSITASGAAHVPPAPPAGARPEESLQAATGVLVNLRRNPYLVVGSTAQQLRTVLSALGPVRGGQRFGAFTDWEVAWRYRHSEAAEGRRICEVTIDLSVRIAMPRWCPPRSAPAGLVAAWEAYVAAVELHEQGHVALAVDAGAAVRRRLLELPALGSSAALDAAARTAAEEALRDARERELAYDRETCHGAAQGVRLPEVP
jgi:predicted secreted Zn-dependent protease